jgi:hypothetical protein
MALPSPRRLRYVAAACVTTALVLATTPAMGVATDTPSTTWGTNGRVKAMVTVGSVTVLGGDFTTVTDTSGHSFPAQRLAVINNSTGAVNTAWSGSADDSVYSLAVLGNTVYVGGAFSKLDGVAHRNLGAVSLSTGALVSSFQSTANKPVDAISAISGAVFVGGQFTSLTVGSTTTNRQFIARVDPTSGAVTSGWSASPDARVRALVASGSTLYVGGDFTTVSGQSHRSTAALSVATGANLSSWHGGPTNANQNAPVYGLDLNGSTLYLAAAGGGGACTAFNATTGARIWTKHANGNLQAVRYNNGVVYCGGHFGGSGSFDGQTRYKMAAVSATAPYTTLSFAPHFNSALGVWSLASDATHVFAGGDFTKVNQKKVNHFASFADH